MSDADPTPTLVRLACGLWLLAVVEAGVYSVVLFHNLPIGLLVAMAVFLLTAGVFYSVHLVRILRGRDEGFGLALGCNTSITFSVLIAVHLYHANRFGFAGVPIGPHDWFLLGLGIQLLTALVLAVAGWRSYFAWQTQENADLAAYAAGRRNRRVGSSPQRGGRQ